MIYLPLTEIKLGKHQEAIDDCKEVLRLEPHNTKGIELGAAYHQTEECSLRISLVYKNVFSFDSMDVSK